MTSPSITDAEFAAALAAGRVEADMEIRAQAVRYVADRDSIEILTTRNAGFLIPRGWIGALQDVPIEDLAKLELWPDGSAIELEDRDIHISVDGLMTAILPAMLPFQEIVSKAFVDAPHEFDHVAVMDPLRGDRGIDAACVRRRVHALRSAAAGCHRGPGGAAARRSLPLRERAARVDRGR